MSLPSNPSQPADAKPFLIYVRHRREAKNGTFRPEAFVGFAQSLRSGGFLAALPAEELKSLLYLLSFVTANGHVAPSVLQLAEAFHLSPMKARRRMERLRQITWQGKPLVGYRRFESGLDAFVPQRELFAVGEDPLAQPPPVGQPAATPPGGFREAIIAHTRQHYARPRTEVEAMVAAQLRRADREGGKPGGKPVSEPAPIPAGFTRKQRQLVAALCGCGLSVEQAVPLVGRFEASRIERQIAWLPYRQAHNPAGFLIAAIEGNYAPPRGLPQSAAGAWTASGPPSSETDGAASATVATPPPPPGPLSPAPLSGVTPSVPETEPQARNQSP